MKRDKTLNMSYGTAMNRLRRQITFQLISKLGLDFCYRCGGKLEESTYSIDHIKPWRGESVILFWDLDNIAYSHKSCNSSNKRHVNRYGPEIKKPPGYYYCCECKFLKMKSEFWKDKRHCKKCRNKRNNEWRYRTGKRKEGAVQGTNES